MHREHQRSKNFHRVAAENQSCDAVSKNAALAKETGDPWSDIARAQSSLKALYSAYSFQETRGGFSSDLFRYARALVRDAFAASDSGLSFDSPVSK